MPSNKREGCRVKSSSNTISLGAGRLERGVGEPWSIFPAAREASMNSFKRRVVVPVIESSHSAFDLEGFFGIRTVHAAVLACIHT
jgi:hypothetical protein